MTEDTDFAVHIEHEDLDQLSHQLALAANNYSSMIGDTYTSGLNDEPPLWVWEFGSAVDAWNFMRDIITIVEENSIVAGFSIDLDTAPPLDSE